MASIRDTLSVICREGAAEGGQLGETGALDPTLHVILYYTVGISVMCWDNSSLPFIVGGATVGLVTCHAAMHSLLSKVMC